MTEKALQAAIVQTARLLGYLVYHTYDSRRSQPGFPDLTIVGHGRLIFAENKTEKGVLSRDQMGWLAELENAGCEVHVWRPAQWLDGTVERVLRDVQERAA